MRMAGTSAIGSISTAMHVGFPTVTQPQPADASVLTRVERAANAFGAAAGQVKSLLEELTDDDRREVRQNHNMFDVLTSTARDARDTADQIGQLFGGE